MCSARSLYRRVGILVGMTLNPDDIVCQCFRVSLRKIETFCRVVRPVTASAISECFSAGCGCGTCRPMLQEIHRRICRRPAGIEPRNVEQEIDAAKP